MAFDPNTAKLKFDPTTAKIKEEEKPRPKALIGNPLSPFKEPPMGMPGTPGARSIGEGVQETLRVADSLSAAGHPIQAGIHAMLGGPARFAGSVAGTAIESGVPKLAELAGRAGKFALSQSSIPELAGMAKEKFPTAYRTIGDLLSFGGLASTPYTGPLAVKAAKAPVKMAGEVVGKPLESLGKWGYEKQLGITKTESRKAGTDAVEGLDNIINDISKYGIDSPLGLNRAKNKTIDLIQREHNNAERLMMREISKPDNALKTVDVDQLVIEAMDEFKDAEGMMLTHEKAQDLAGRVHKELEDKGLTGVQYVDKIPKIKKTLEKGLGLFKKGPFHLVEDPLPAQVGEKIYFKMMDAVNKEIPGLGETNQKISHLLRVKKTIDDARFKERASGNTIKGMLTSTAATAGTTALTNPEQFLWGLAAGIPAYYGVKATPSILMKTGRTLQGKKTTLGDIVKELSPEEMSRIKYNIENRRMKITPTGIPKTSLSLTPEMLRDILTRYEAEGGEFPIIEHFAPLRTPRRP